jgi:hypothetical protein
MPLQFCDSMINQYLTRGYLVLRGIVPPKLLRDLRVEAEKARNLAHEINGRQTQRIQPVSKFADKLNQKPFQDYCELPELKDAIEQLLGPEYTHGHVEIMGILVDPLDEPWTCGWHRDGVVEIPPDAYDDEAKACLAEIWHDLRCYNQVNCALYTESCFWYVPGSHLRQIDLPGERQTRQDESFQVDTDKMSNAEKERYYLAHCESFPGAVQVHLGPGDYVVYRNLAWHIGNYIPHQRRATIHDVVRYHGPRSKTNWGQAKKAAVERMNARKAD